MTRSTRRKTIPTLVCFAALLVAPAAATAQQATPADRCEGTLCDLYYGGSPPPPQPGKQVQAPKPITAPSGGIMGFFSGGNAAQGAGAQGAASAPVKRPLVGVGGGGLASMARGDAPERCSGSLCDLYYGGPPPDKPTQGAAPQGSEQQATVEPASEADLAPAEPRVRYRPLPEEKPACAPRPHDPWSCYR